MKRYVTLIAFAGLTAFPVVAKANDESPSLLEQGAKLFIEGLVQEMEPAVSDLLGMAENLEPALREFALEMGPALIEILGQIEDLSTYHLPEILPNGDIIIRKKTPQEMVDELENQEEIEI